MKYIHTSAIISILLFLIIFKENLNAFADSSSDAYIFCNIFDHRNKKYYDSKIILGDANLLLSYESLFLKFIDYKYGGVYAISLCFKFPTAQAAYQTKQFDENMSAEQGYVVISDTWGFGQ